MNSADLRYNLEKFTGTEFYYKLTPFPLLATDGVTYFVDKAEAYWLITDIAAIMYSNLKNEPFVVIKAVSKDNKGKVIYEDGNYNHLYTAHYDYTDLPEGQWRFFLYNNVIMLPSEY